MNTVDTINQRDRAALDRFLDLAIKGKNDTLLNALVNKRTAG